MVNRRPKRGKMLNYWVNNITSARVLKSMRDTQREKVCEFLSMVLDVVKSGLRTTQILDRYDYFSF